MHLGVLNWPRPVLAAFIVFAAFSDGPKNARPPRGENDLRAWLENMVWHHRFSVDEVHAATGLTRPEIESALRRWNIRAETKPGRAPGAPLLVLPYPGGRHPRIGFLDGAIDPQRETKLSIFTPWDDSSYIVADVPEAIWSNLGLTYLAHTHVPTIWTREKIDLPALEWQKLDDGTYQLERSLPNGIRFGTRARAMREYVGMKMWLSNGTSSALSDLRVQNCVMLKGAPEFSQQSNSNKVMRGAFAACRNPAGDRWVITAWKTIHRAWANPPVPCLHADPKFPDTPPGATSVVSGLVTFYEGKQIETKLEELDRKWPELVDW